MNVDDAESIRHDPEGGRLPINLRCHSKRAGVQSGPYDGVLQIMSILSTSLQLRVALLSRQESIALQGPALSNSWRLGRDFFTLLVWIILLVSHPLVQAQTIPVSGGGTLSFSETTGKYSCPYFDLEVFGTLYSYTGFTYNYGGNSYSLDGNISWGEPSRCIGQAPPVVLQRSLPSKFRGGNCQLNITISGSSSSDVAASLSCALTSTVGYLNPRYLIIGVTYAPPGGSQSSISYQSSVAVGNTSTLTSSFTSELSQTVSITNGGDILGFAKGDVSANSSSTWNQTQTSENSVDISKKTTTTLKTPGVPNVYSPINHDYDIVWIWLNPTVNFTLYKDKQGKTASLEWNGYGYDMADPINGMDVWPIYVGYLNGDFGSLSPQDASALSRSWANGQVFPDGKGPAISSADFPQILNADPFAQNPTALSSGYELVTVPNSFPPTSIDGRFTMPMAGNSNQQSIAYRQAGPGSSVGLQDTYSAEYSSATSTTNTSENSYAVGFGFEAKFSVDFFAQGSISLKDSTKLTWKNTSKATQKTTNVQTATALIASPPCPSTTPPCNPLYTEPHEFAIYQDNIYGSFLFWPNPYHSISSVKPSAASLTAGGSVSYALQTQAHANYAGNILTVSVTGLPSSASALPLSVKTGEVAVISITTSTDTKPGSYNLTFTSNDGSQTYYTYATLDVAASSATGGGSNGGSGSDGGGTGNGGNSSSGGSTGGGAIDIFDFFVLLLGVVALRSAPRRLNHSTYRGENNHN